MSKRFSPWACILLGLILSTAVLLIVDGARFAEVMGLYPDTENLENTHG